MLGKPPEVALLLMSEPPIAPRRGRQTAAWFVPWPRFRLCRSINAALDMTVRADDVRPVVWHGNRVQIGLWKHLLLDFWSVAAGSSAQATGGFHLSQVCRYVGNRQ
jgi:hypothetical protein